MRKLSLSAFLPDNVAFGVLHFYLFDGVMLLSCCIVGTTVTTDIDGMHSCGASETSDAVCPVGVSPCPDQDILDPEDPKDELPSFCDDCCEKEDVGIDYCLGPPVKPICNASCHDDDGDGPVKIIHCDDGCCDEGEDVVANETDITGHTCSAANGASFVTPRIGPAGLICSFTSLMPGRCLGSICTHFAGSLSHTQAHA